MYETMNSLTAGAVWPVVWGERSGPDGLERERLERRVREKVEREQEREAEREKVN